MMKKKLHCTCLSLLLLLSFALLPSAAAEKISPEDDALLEKIQRASFRYFWDFCEPNSKLPLEQSVFNTAIPAGASGYAVGTLPIAVERGWVTRQQAVERLLKILDFFEHGERFHGVWPHWLHGRTRKVIPFSRYDDGADVVETALLVSGLLAAAEYFNQPTPEEKLAREKIKKLWEGVDWAFFTDGKKVLHWHWSPKHGFSKTFPVVGWNEGLILYILAAGSPTHPIKPEVYHEGWARNGHIKNRAPNPPELEKKGVRIPLGAPWGGPAFLVQYSFLFLDPRGLSDKYADYWQQAVNYTHANYLYCVEKADKSFRYGPTCWGLTASNGPNGYHAFSPSDDDGTIAPTAAIGSMPFLPQHCLPAAKNFLTLQEGKLFEKNGFIASFNPKLDWYAKRSFALDHMVNVVMIENYRSGLPWTLLKKNKDVQVGLKKLGFTYQKP